MYKLFAQERRTGPYRFIGMFTWENIWKECAAAMAYSHAISVEKD